jgi:hypothetical protein
MLRIKLLVVTLVLVLTGAVSTVAQDAAQNTDAHKHDAADCCKMAGHKSGDKDKHDASAHSCCAHEEGAGCCASQDSCPLPKASAKDASAKSAEHKGDCCAAMASAHKEHKHEQATAASHGAEKMSCCAAGASCCGDGAACCKAHQQATAKAKTAANSSGEEDKAHASCCAHGSSCCHAQVARRR